MSSTPTYYQTPPAISGVELSPNLSFWWLVAPEPTINLITNPSFELALSASYIYNNATGTRVYRDSASINLNNFLTKGLYGLKIVPSSAASSYIDLDLGATAYSGAYTWSLDVQGAGGEVFEIAIIATIGTVKENILTFTASGGVDRVYVTNPNTANSYHLRLTKNSTTTKPYYTDAWQWENKAYPTTYIDGDHPGGIWLGAPNASTSQRPLGVAGGRRYNFKTDLGFEIEAYQFAGLPPVINHATKNGLLSGASYNRTRTEVRNLILGGIFEGAPLAELHRKIAKLEQICKPDNTTHKAAPLLIQYQMVDATSGAGGAALQSSLMELPVNYSSGLEGATDNPSQEKVALRFEAYLNPGITESAQERSMSVTYKTTVNYSAGQNVPQMPSRDSNGTWYRPLVQALSFTNLDGSRTFSATGTRAKEITISGGVLSSTDIAPGPAAPTPTTANINVLAMSPDRKLYAGGDNTGATFTYAGYYDMVTLPAAWTVLNYGLNALVRAICVERNSSYIYYGGDFTQAGNIVLGDVTANRVAIWTGANGSWNPMITGGNNGVNNVVRALACGLDNKIIVGGDFTSAGGVVTNRIASWTRTPTLGLVTGTWAAMPSGGTGANGTVRAIAVNPLNGLVYIGGDFTSVNGVSCSYIAVYNGVQWSPVGASLNGAVYSLWFGADGTLYAGGLFTGTNGTPSVNFPTGAATFNGSVWQPLDIAIVTAAAANFVAGTTDITNQIFMGTNTLTAGTVGQPFVHTAYVTTVTNAGSADVNPKFVIRGPGTLYQIKNITTGQAIYFNNCVLQAGEVATLTLAQTQTSFVSSFYGNILDKLLPGSDTATFELLPSTKDYPGTNLLSVLMVGSYSSATAVELYYYNTHWSFKGGVY